VPWSLRNNFSTIMNQPLRSNTWSGGAQGQGMASVPRMDYYGSYSYGDLGDDFDERMDAHQRKAALELAKAAYKEEKERFRQEKEERRRVRREAAERRAEEGILGPGVRREETIVARIPLASSPLPSSSRLSGPQRPLSADRRPAPFAEVYSVPMGHRRPAATAGGLSEEQQPGSSRGTGTQNYNMSDSLMGRLADMGFTPSTHPNIVSLLNQHLYANGEPTKDSEEEILTKMIHALDIRGSPSPRPSGGAAAEYFNAI